MFVLSIMKVCMPLCSSHAITSDVSLSETAKAAEFFLSDGLIITGTATGEPVNTDDLAGVRDVTSLPVILGSGVTEENVEEYMTANAFIVGSYFKRNGLWYNPVDPERVQKLMTKLRTIRSSNV
jgi:predicted TIM-barrel enzyme